MNEQNNNHQNYQNITTTTNDETIHDTYQPFARNDIYGACGFHGPQFTITRWIRLFYKSILITILLSSLMVLILVYTVLNKVINMTFNMVLRKKNDTTTTTGGNNRNIWSQWILPIYIRIIMYIIGFELQFKSYNKSKNQPFSSSQKTQVEASVLICNHISYIDILMIICGLGCTSDYTISFVAKESIQL